MARFGMELSDRGEYDLKGVPGHGDVRSRGVNRPVMRSGLETGGHLGTADRERLMDAPDRRVGVILNRTPCHRWRGSQGGTTALTTSEAPMDATVRSPVDLA